jgi:PAS domain S-box-containing protein
MSKRMRVWHFISRPYSLRTAIMAGATVVVVALGTLLAAIAYQRLQDVTANNATRWSESVARLMSNSNTSAFILNDIAAMESSLQQIAMLPGIDRAAIYRADGRVLVTAVKEGDVVQSQVGGTEHIPIAVQGVTRLPNVQAEDYFEAWAPIMTGKTYPSAWCQVRISTAQRNAQLSRLSQASAAGIALLVILVLVSLHCITGRALKPIRLLSQFAQRMPTNIGSQIALTRNWIEVTQLGHALNGASRGIADQIKRTQSIVNTATEAIIGLDDEGQVTTLNPAATSFFGRPETDLMFHPIAQCVPGLDKTALHDMFDAGASYGSALNRVVRTDFFGTRSDGTLFPLEISIGQVTGIEGLRYVCIMHDVTDERAALEFTELYERALACSHNSVFITNAKLDHQPIVYVNRAFQNLLQRPLHTILGLNMEDLLEVDTDDSAVTELRLAVAEQRNTNVTLHRKNDDGNLRILEVSISPVRSDKGLLTHFVGIVLDVTARVVAEEANAKRRAQLDTIFSLSPDGFVFFDANDRMVFANPSVERMTGLAWSESTTAIGLDTFEAMLKDVCDSAHPFTSFSDAAQDKEAWQARLHLVRPQPRVVQAESRRSHAGQGETIFYFRDVTHEDAVDRMKSEFLAAAAHELRTPMVSIFGFTELLIKRKFTPERQVDMLETIHRQSGLLVKMINELLDLARIESRRGLDLHIEAHPLDALINNSVKGLMRKDTDRQVTIGELPQAQVMIDPEKMQLAMNNLLSNAFKYSPQGGEVSVSATLDSCEDQEFAVIEVKDQGMGMSPEQLSRAFERFYRADASGNIPGTGLGLSLVREVATLHNGQIELDSELGRGTTARLWIPLARVLTAA